MTLPPAALAAALADRYVLEKEIGRGGMALVYLASRTGTGERVALKVLNAELAKTVGADRFKREIRVAGGLDHPNILRVLDSGEVGDQLWFTMPFVAGTTLQDRLEKGGPLEVAEALRITKAVGSALAAAHAKDVVHRDIKPDNILLEDSAVLVADFGVARAVSENAEKLTATGIIVGTPVYMSPEQASGEKVIDGRTDQYALASVLYEMLTGEPPFKGPTPAATLMRRFAGPPRPLRPVIPVSEAVEGAIMRALDKEPDNRFATMQEFLDALDGKAAPLPVKAAGVPAPTPAGPTAVDTGKRGCLGMLLGALGLHLFGARA
ncbi:MAG: serine/threonine protein kinase [Gemmatimonadetes bacterium]|nr:serine/threonine protein kinase [Gemmatimonadota bacterium]